MTADDDQKGGGLISSYPPDPGDATVVSQAPSEMMEQIRAQYPVEPQPADASPHAGTANAVPPPPTPAAGAPPPSAAVGVPGPKPVGGRAFPPRPSFGMATVAGLGIPAPGSAPGAPAPARAPAPLPAAGAPPMVPAPPGFQADPGAQIHDFTGGDDEDVDPNGPTMLRAAPAAAQAARASFPDARGAGAIGEPLATPAPFPAPPAPGMGHTAPLNAESQQAMRAAIDAVGHGSVPQQAAWNQGGAAWHSNAIAPQQATGSYSAQYTGAAKPAGSGLPRWALLVLVGGGAALVVFLVLGVAAFFLLRPARRTGRHV